MNTAQHMEYSQLLQLREQNPAWRLLAAEQCSFVAAFLYSEFIAKDVRLITEEQLLEDLENFIIKQQSSGNLSESFRPAREYLATWCDAQHSWLRRFYQKEEACYDLTASAQKAIEWLYSLKKQSFVGTKSRIRNVVKLLSDIDNNTSLDRNVRINKLKEQKLQIEREIARLEGYGEIILPDELQIKEDFRHAASIARDILSDFREVEENFRSLEHQLMENIITWKKGKGELLEKFFEDRDFILHSEQGRSFYNFWEYITSENNRTELEDILNRLLKNQTIREENKDVDISHIRRQWAQAAAQVQKTVISLSRQIRQYVDENYLNQEKYIYGLIKNIEDKAVQVKDNMPKGIDFFELDQMAPSLDILMDRPLYNPPQKPVLEKQVIKTGDIQPSVDIMFKQVYVDKDKLQDRIDTLIEETGRKNLPIDVLLQKHPLEKGLTELLTYMLIASRDPKGFTDKLDNIDLGYADKTVTCHHMVFHKNKAK